jgi:hypothetical protein
VICIARIKDASADSPRRVDAIGHGALARACARARSIERSDDTVTSAHKAVRHAARVSEPASDGPRRGDAGALREERQSLTIDSPEAIAHLCSEMRFLDRESLRVVLLNAEQHLMKVCTVSQGSVNESLGHPREIFKPVIVHSAYSFIMVHNPESPRGEQNPAALVDGSRHYWRSRSRAK